jgi:hypothetical protein
LSERPIDQFTKDYFGELVRFMENPYQYSTDNETGEGTDDRPNWFKGIISGGKRREETEQETPSEEE